MIVSKADSWRHVDHRMPVIAGIMEAIGSRRCNSFGFLTAIQFE